jgi:hypothetical protein
MGLLRAIPCARCGRDVRGLSDTRKEHGLSFCSQSCYLQWASSATHAGKLPSGHSSRGATVGGLRLVGKTIKWALILVVLGTTALVIAIVVAVAHGLNDVNKTIDRVDASSRRAAAVYPRIKRGIRPAQLRRRLGKPEDVEADGYVNGGVCWYYGNVFSSTGKEFEFCFKRGKLYSKSRL